MIATLTQPLSTSEKRRLLKRTARRGNVQEKILKEPSLLIVDLFCGAGGVTTGFALSGIAKILACINHDHNAIISHWANHPRVKHFEEDMRTLALERLIAIVEVARLMHPNAKLVLWASLECTNFSKAKGGMARDADSRTLADHLHRYILALNPDYIMIENVVEFKEWGPMQIKCKAYHADRCDLHTMKKKAPKKPRRKKGEPPAVAVPIEWVYGWVPVPATKGQDYRRWCKEVCAHGYEMEWREMNSADFGAYTSRNRLFGMFVKPGLNKIWPEKTHAKTGVTQAEWNKFFKRGEVKRFKWMAVKEVLDFSDEGYSIFHRAINMDIPAKQREDLVENTLERLYMGCIKHIAGGKDKFEARRLSASLSFTPTTTSFIKKYYGGRADSRSTSIYDPLSVIPCENRHALVNVSFISKYFSGVPYNKNISTDGPAGTIKTKDGQALIQGKFLDQRNGGDPASRSVDINGPARVLTGSGGNQQLVTPCFLSCYYGKGDNAHSIEGTHPVIRTKDGSALVHLSYLDKSYSGSANHSSIELPAGSVLPNDKHSLVQPVFIDRQFSSGGRSSQLCEPAGAIVQVPKLNLINVTTGFIDSTQYANTPAGLDEPSRVLTADRHWPYLCNLSYGGSLHDVSNPAPVIIAGQGKAPIYLFLTERGEYTIQVYDTDSPFTKKLKEFMALYGIIDIKMRMLKVPELLKIQGFPEKYHLKGSQADQKKFIGNSVVPHVVKAWAIAIHDDLCEYHLKAA